MFRQNHTKPDRCFVAWVWVPAWNIGLIENWQNWGEQGPTDFQALSKLDLILTCDPSVGEACLRDEDATKADKGLLPIIYCVQYIYIIMIIIIITIIIYFKP